MTLILTVLAWMALTMALVALVVPREDQWKLGLLLVTAWIPLTLLLVVVHEFFPYAGGGDDWEYFQLASSIFNDFSDIFDFDKYIGIVEQPGYPLLLTVFKQFVGHDLLVLKTLNIFFFIATALVYYLIGSRLESRQFGRFAAQVVLLLTPVWYYWMFLLKDIVIVAIQGLFLLGLVELVASRARKGWMLVLVSTLGILPFRSQMVLLHVTVLAVATLLLGFPRRRKRWLLLGVLGSLLVVSVSLYIASNPAILAALGILGETRTVGLETSVVAARAAMQESTMNRALFPLLYLFGETAGLSPGSWQDFDAFSLRGVLAVPWILLLVPFFLLGLKWLAVPPGDPALPGGQRVGYARALTTPWGAMLVFLAFYMLLAWVVGDSTRWRLADMPVMATIAAAGWYFASGGARHFVGWAWGGFSTLSFLVFYWSK